jgi:hypothetical protein
MGERNWICWRFFLDAPRGLIQFYFVIHRRHDPGIRIADQMGCKIVETDADRAVFPRF